MINRFNLTTVSLCLIFLAGFCSAQAQLFGNKTKDLPEFQGSGEKKGPKISGLFPKKPTAPEDSVSTTIPDTSAVTDLATTTIEKPKKDRRLKLPFSKRKKDEVILTAETETLVNENGVLVKPGETQEDVKFPTTPSSSGTSSKPQAPRSEGGSVVYNDWDDVKAYKSSAAQQIIAQMRAQEAAHKKKQAAAEQAMEARLREAEARMKKAQEEQRKRALLQGGGGGGRLPQIGGPPGGIPGL